MQAEIPDPVETHSFAKVPDPPKPGDDRVYGELIETGHQGLLRRALATQRHLYGLLFGGLAAWLRDMPSERRGVWTFLLRVVVATGGIFVDRKLKRRPFAVQLRRRFELLGPTYIKLGQALSLREDLLPKTVTDELKNLLDLLPATPYRRFLERVEKSLGRPVEQVFAHIRSTPIGSASIGQTHVATTLDGEQVILKIVKPGIRETLRRDTLLLRMLGAVLQVFMGRYQPRRVLGEFCESVLREVDLKREADNAETFAASFRDLPDIVFPRIHRELSDRDLLVMEYLDGIKPTDPKALELRLEDREKLVEFGAQAIIRMLYRDGFFHADLHPGNLIILPGPRLGFIDLGMVGRFDTDLKRALLYYYFSLVMEDAESAAGYLTALAETGPRSDPNAFRLDVEEVCRQWAHRARFNSFSLGNLMMDSVSRSARHRMYFPGEMVLMAKAIVTFEAVGRILVPEFDIVKVSRKYVQGILLERFGPLHLLQESITTLPALADSLAKTPRLISEGLRLVEQATRQPSANPFAGMRATIFGGFCMVSGAILAAFDGPWPIWAALLIFGLLLPLRRGE